MRLPLALMVCLAGLSAPVLAQSLTDDELLKLFTTQRDAFKAAQSNAMGKTRGLTLVTVDTVAVTTTAGSVTTLAPADATDTSGTVSVTPDATTTTNVATTGLSARSRCSALTARSSPRWPWLWRRGFR